MNNIYTNNSRIRHPVRTLSGSLRGLERVFWGGLDRFFTKPTELPQLCSFLAIQTCAQRRKSHVLQWAHLSKIYDVILPQTSGIHQFFQALFILISKEPSYRYQLGERSSISFCMVHSSFYCLEGVLHLLSKVYISMLTFCRLCLIFGLLSKPKPFYITIPIESGRPKHFWACRHHPQSPHALKKVG